MSKFEYDAGKDAVNRDKHGVSFQLAEQAFYDPQRIIVTDEGHSSEAEKRYFCFGVAGGGILTVRFTMRGTVIRIFGAAYWRKGKKIYEQENHL